MPLGPLISPPVTFQRLMERTLGDLKAVTCCVYLDDIIIFSRCWKQHIQDAQVVLNKFREAATTVNMKKSNLFRFSLKFLGHVISATGVYMDPDKIGAVCDFTVPSNLKSQQKFLGMTD